MLTSDGNSVMMLSQAKQAVFFSPIYRAGGLLMSSRADRATLPFSQPSQITDIQKGSGFRSAGVEEIDGVACDVVYGEVPDDKQRLELAVAQKDHLPRRVVFRSTDKEAPGDDAVIAIKKAWESGYRDSVWTRRDPDLASLHGHPEFERLFPPSANA